MRHMPKTKANKLIQYSVGLIALCAIVFGATRPSGATGSASLSLTPTSGTYTVGQTIPVTVNENSGSEGVSAVESDIIYDPALLDVASVDTSGSGFPHCLDTNIVSVPTYEVQIACSQFSVDVTGPVKVVTVNFRVKAPGNVNLSFADDSTRIIDPVLTPSTDAWNHSNSTASFVLKAAPTPPPTPTPTPTPPPSSGGGTSGSKPSAGGTKNSGGTSSSKSTTASSTVQTPQTPAANAPEGTVKTLTPSTYLVSIHVVDAKNKPIAGATVKLDTGETATTDKTGVAGFLDVSAGSHNATVTYKGKSTKQNFEVTASGTPNQSLQKFNVKLDASHSATTPVIVIIGLFALLAVAVYVFILPRRNRFKPIGSTGGNSDTHAVVGGGNNTVHTPPPAPTVQPTVVSPTANRAPAEMPSTIIHPTTENPSSDDEEPKA